MTERAKVAFSVAQRASWDPDFMRSLVQDPVDTVQRIERNLDRNEAKEIASRAAEIISALPGSEILKLVKELFINATNAFKLTIRLSQILFYVGIGIIVGALAFEIIGRVLGNTSWQDVATTGVIGAVGIGSIVSSFILRPLGSIQNSVGNLSQVQIGFLSFIDRRQVLLQTNTSGNMSDMKQLSDEMEKAASATMKLIENFCEYRAK